MGYSPPKAPGNPYASIGGATMEPGGGFAPPQPAGVSTMQSGAGNPTAPGILPNWLHRMRGGKVSRTRMMMQHRAGGGGVLPSGTALVHYKRPGISVGGSRPVTQEGDMVTGGTGAAPALSGRIGYRGRLTSGTPPVDGINAEKQYQNQKALNAGARKEIDPVTGLSQNPTQNEINAQIQMLAGKGDPAGLEGQGVGGSKQAQSVAAYYQAKQNGNPDAIAQATQGVQNLKRTINGVGQPQQQSQSPAGAPVQDAGVKPNAFPDAPPLNDPNTLDTPGLKTGGKEQPVHPYDVNEEGTESVKYKGEKPQLIPGGEHVVTFPKSGRVIPHGRTMQMMSKGMIQPTEADPTSPASPVSSGPNPPMGQPTEYDPNPPASPTHRAGGGKVGRTKRFVAPPQQPVSQVSRLLHAANPMNWEEGLGNPADVSQPLSSAFAPVENLPPDPRLHSFAKDHPENAVAEGDEEESFEDVPTRDFSETASTDQSPISSIIDQILGTNSGTSTIGAPSPMAPAPAAPMAPASPNSIVQAVMGNRGTDMITPQGSANPEFVTPYGFVGGAAHGGPHVSEGGGQPWVNPETQFNYIKPANYHSADEYNQQQLDAKHQQQAGDLQSQINRNNAADEAAGVKLPGIKYPHRMKGGNVSRTRMMMRHTDGR